MTANSDQSGEWVLTEPSESHIGFSQRNEDGEFWCLRCHGNAPEGVIAALTAVSTLREQRDDWHERATIARAQLAAVTHERDTVREQLAEGRKLLQRIDDWPRDSDGNLYAADAEHMRRLAREFWLSSITALDEAPPQARDEETK